MSSRIPDRTQASAEPESVGLCVRCRYSRTVRGRRSLFWFCERSRTDPRFVKYPRLPVQECTGFEPNDPPEPGAGSDVS